MISYIYKSNLSLACRQVVQPYLPMFAFVILKRIRKHSGCWLASLMTITSLLFFLRADSQSVTAAFVTLPVSSFFFLSGGRVKTWKRRWFILTDNCLYYFEYTTVSLTPTCFFFWLTKGISAAVCVCLCHHRAEHFIFILRSLYEIHPESTASLLIITSSLFHSTRKTARINNSSLLHCCHGYGFQQGALHVNSTNQT